MWRHKNSGRLYKIIDFNAMVKIDDVWHDAVIYKSVNGNEKQIFVRPKDNFIVKFDEVGSIGGV